MKILQTLAVLGGLAFITSASAQTYTKDEQAMAQKKTNEVKRNVTGLTSNQESKVLMVEQEHAKACADAKTAASGNKDTYKSKKKELCDNRDAKLKAILTASQYAQYEKTEKADKEDGM